MTILPKAIYTFDAIPIMSPMTFFTKLEKNSLILYRDIKDPKRHKRTAKAILRKKNGAGPIRLPDHSPCYKAAAIRAVWHWPQTRNADRWSRAGGSGTSGQLSVTEWCWEDWTAICKNTKSENSLTPYRKVDSKWIKDKCRTRRKTQSEHFWHESQQCIFQAISQSNGNKNKSKQVGSN